MGSGSEGQGKYGKKRNNRIRLPEKRKDSSRVPVLMKNVKTAKGEQKKKDNEEGFVTNRKIE